MQHLQLQEGHAFVVRERSAARRVLARSVRCITIGSSLCRDTLSTAIMRDGKAWIGRIVHLQGCKRLILATAPIATHQASSRHTWEMGE